MARQQKPTTGPNGVSATGPAFTRTMQIDIVVRDLDATARRYVEDYGIGPWQFHEFKRGDFIEWREHGQPVESFSRIATAMIGGVQWELIEPLGDNGILARFLAEKGGGVHHIAVATSNFDETLAAEAKRGNELALSCELGGEFGGIKVAYLNTQRSLGVILEVYSGLPEGKHKPE